MAKVYDLNPELLNETLNVPVIEMHDGKIPGMFVPAILLAKTNPHPHLVRSFFIGRSSTDIRKYSFL